MPLTDQQQKRLDWLTMLVSLRVEEYLESVAEAKDADIPFGDIQYELEQAGKYILRLVKRPISFSSAKKAKYAFPIEDTARGCLVIPLPDDYLRFTRIKIDGWALGVSSYMSDLSRAYKQQIYYQRRGVKEKPVVFLVPHLSEYQAHTLADGEIYAEKTGGEGVPNVGDVLTHDGATAAQVVDTSETNFIILKEAGTYNNPASGDLLERDDYQLTVRYKSGDTATRQAPEVKQALEVYPIADGTIEELIYIPFLKPYDIPVELEDAVIWRTVSVILQIMRESNLAQEALAQMVTNLSALNTGMIGEEDEEIRTQ